MMMTISLSPRLDARKQQRSRLVFFFHTKSKSSFHTPRAHTTTVAGFLPSMAHETMLYEQALVPLESEVGQAYTSHLSDIVLPRTTLLIDAFEPQQSASWCGLACVRMAMKVLVGPDIGRPALPSQRDLLEMARSWSAARHIDRDALRAGISLSELEAFLTKVLASDPQMQFAHANVCRRDATDPALFGAALVSDLDDVASQQHSPILLVNLLRYVAGAWSGHWMVVAGSVRVGGEQWVLMLDPAAHKLGPHWLPRSTLASAMCTFNSRGEPRGYILIGNSGGTGAIAGRDAMQHQGYGSSAHAGY